MLEQNTSGIFHNITSSFIEDDSYYDYEFLRTRSLWRSVIMQALIDAGNNSKKKSAKSHKIKAIEWLTLPIYNEDFEEICVMAGMDPGYVKNKAMIAMSRGCKWRNDSRKMLPIKISHIDCKSHAVHAAHAA